MADEKLRAPEQVAKLVLPHVVRRLLSGVPVKVDEMLEPTAVLVDYADGSTNRLR